MSYDITLKVKDSNKDMQVRKKEKKIAKEELEDKLYKNIDEILDTLEAGD